MLRRRICMALAVLACVVQPVVAAPIGSAITYQGRLESGGAPYHGTAALRFTLFDSEVGGTQVVGPFELVNVPVTGGVFTVNLDFGPSAFGPDARWLAVEVRTASPAFGCGVVPCTLLTPRQRIAPAPVALYALNAPASTSYWNASGVHIYNANAGNVGIGTATPTAKLHTAGDILASGSAGSIWLRPDLPGIPMIQSFSDMEIRTTTGNLRLNPISPGRVGVGVQTPAAKLHVAADTASAANNTASFEAPMIGPNASHVHFGTKGDWYIRSAASDGTGKVVIQDTLGPVGIGTNNPVGSKVHVVANDIVGLQVQNSMGNGQGILVTANTGASPRALHAIGPPDSGFAGYFAGRMHVSGNVGLGTESPLHNLHMVASQAVARLDSTSNLSGSVLELRNNTVSPTGIGAINFVNSAGAVNGQLAYLANDAFAFRAGGSERVRISSAGNVGIGTSAPGFKLHVAAGNADALFAGNLGTSPNPTTGQAALYGVGAIGARGVSNLTNGCGVVGIANNGASAVGVLGEATGGGYAGWFQGRAHVTGTLSKGGGAFKIDHPLDPENKYLYHSFVESPDMMNIYNGNVVTDDHGYATVALPDWFDTLNHDFRYQLTVVDEHDGADFVLAKVVRTVQDNQFTIRSSAPHATVSWQVTGIRQDPWAEANRIPVEEDKLSHERGFYVHPELYGFDASRNLAEAKSVLAAEPAGRAAPERSPAPRTPAARGSAEGR
ncbi:MAG: hypothetical protein HRU75_03335 [Planctomycetia bacterium]|nr:MAG: hypothetical protein HRU75_03335 [Planctomycetia bacterium]